MDERRSAFRRALFQKKTVKKPLPTRSSRYSLAGDGRPPDGRRPLGGSSARELEPGPRRRVTRVRDVAACARPRRTVTRGGKARLPFRASVQLGKTDISTMTGAGRDRGRLLRDGKESAGRAGRQPECRRERTAGAALPARALWLPRECRSDELVAIVKICSSHFLAPDVFAVRKPERLEMTSCMSNQSDVLQIRLFCDIWRLRACRGVIKLNTHPFLLLRVLKKIACAWVVAQRRRAWTPTPCPTVRGAPLAQLHPGPEAVETLADEPIPGPRAESPLVHFSWGWPRKRRRLLGSRPPWRVCVSRPVP